MLKIDRKYQENIKKIKDLELAGDGQQVVLHLKLHQRLHEMRRDLAAELGVVVIK